MQAIQTRYMPATNFRGSRIKASCARGSITVSYPHELSGDAVHVFAANQLVFKFIKEDAEKYGTNQQTNPWSAHRSVGTLRDGTVVHVFAS